jgi:hypothetical protein
MIRIRRGGNIMSLMLKPLCIVLLLFAQFGLVWLKSNVITLEYNISTLEKKNAECLKERKILFVEKAGLQSFESVESSMSGNYGFVFPDRIKVIHVKTQKGPLPYKVSLKRRQTGGP